MSKTSTRYGRLGNQIVRNLAVHFIAKKHDLHVTYSNKDIITSMGIDLHCGKIKHLKTISLTDTNYFDILNAETSPYNVNSDSEYFQTKRITDMLHAHLNSDEVLTKVVSSNQHRDRYNSNNDCFIHIRLGDVQKWNPGVEYYRKTLSKLPQVDNIYISTDTPNHAIISTLKKEFPKSQVIKKNDLKDIIQFGSTCRYVILSYGTFSACIGYLSYYSTVYCLPFKEKYCWDWNARSECDMFQNKTTKLGPWIVFNDND